MLPPTLRLGPVELVVSDVARSAAWYEQTLGLPPDNGVVRLHEDPAARPAGRHAGIFHYALLFPSREELAHALLRLAATRTPISGAADHGVSEAIYLRDPDGIGIELYRDRPRDEWPPPEREGERVGIVTEPLDLDDLMATVAGETAQPHAGADVGVGHVHLNVGDVARGVAFYCDAVGFDLMATVPGAAFVAAGGYHHHLAFNVWHGEGVPPQPEHVAGLRNWTIVLDDPDEGVALGRRLGAIAADDDGRILVRDPWNIGLAITAAA